MKKFRFGAVILSLVMLVNLFAGCGKTTDSSSANDETVYKMKLACATSLPATEAYFITELESRIEEATGGRVDVEVYTSGTLGTNAQVIQGLQDGSVEGVQLPISYYESYVSEIGIFGLPAVFESAKQAYELCWGENDFNHMLRTLLEEKGFMVGAWTLAADSVLLARGEFDSFEDFSGMNIWALPNASLSQTLLSTNAVPVNFDTGDLAVGMQQGTVDGCYGGAQLFNSLKLQEFASTLVVPTKTINYAMQALMLSKSFMDQLPEDLRDIVLKTIEETWFDIGYDYADNAITNALENIKNTEGITTWYTDEDFNNAVSEATSNVIDNFIAASDSNKKLYDIVISLLN